MPINYEMSSKYIVGAGQLRVFLDGILCEAGEREQYVEAGQAGDLSDYIRFNDTIDPSHDIRIEIPVSGLQNAGILDGTIVTVKDLMRLIVQSAMLDYGLGVITERADSLPGTRLKEYAGGDTYTVPQYLVGGNGLQVFVDGLLCVRGVDYDEASGSDGDRATTITWRRAVPVTSTVSVICRDVRATVIQ